MSLMHEDFQTDNIVISTYGELYTMYRVPFARGQIEGYFGKNVPTDFWAKYTYYMIVKMLYAYTVAVTMEEERAEAQFMFTDQIERIKSKASFVPDWYRGKKILERMVRFKLHWSKG